MPQEGNLADSLDRIEYLMDLEEELTDCITADPTLTREERDHLLRYLDWRFTQGWVDDPDDDSSLSVYVRRFGPRGPKGRSAGAAEKLPN